MTAVPRSSGLPGGTGASGVRLAAVAAVAVGGAAGALARHGIELLWPSPWAIASINIVGALLIGALMGLVGRGWLPALARPLLGVGFLGGFTTFSTAMLQLRDALAAGHVADAVVLCVVPLVGAVVAAGLGWRLSAGPNRPGDPNRRGRSGEPGGPGS